MEYINSTDGNLIRNLLLTDDLKGMNPQGLPIPSSKELVSNPLIKWIITYIYNEPVAIVQLHQTPNEVHAHIGVLEKYRNLSSEIFQGNKAFIKTNFPGIMELVCIVTMSTPNTVRAVKFLSKMGCQFSGIGPTGLKFILGL